MSCVCACVCVQVPFVNNSVVGANGQGGAVSLTSGTSYVSVLSGLFAGNTASQVGTLKPCGVVHDGDKQN